LASCASVTDDLLVVVQLATLGVRDSRRDVNCRALLFWTLGIKMFIENTH